MQFPRIKTPVAYTGGDVGRYLIRQASIPATYSKHLLSRCHHSLWGADMLLTFSNHSLPAVLLAAHPK